MTANLINNVIEEIQSSRLEEDKSNVYVTISIRPGIKLASMLEVYLQLTNKKISSLLTDGISDELYEYVTKNTEYSKAIENACNKLINEKYEMLTSVNGASDDCFDLLLKNDVIKIHTDSFKFN